MLSTALGKMFPTKSREPSALPDYGLTYFHQLVAEYRILHCDGSLAQADLRTAGDSIVGNATPTWGDLYVLEMVISKLQPLAVLRERAVSLRLKYADVIAESDYAAYLRGAPDARTAPEPELRTDPEHVLSEFHWVYSFSSVLEDERNRVSRRVRNLTLFVVLAAGGYAAYSYGTGGGPAPILPVVLALGAMGGFLSLQQRVQDIPSKGDPITSIDQLRQSGPSVYLSPISGSLFCCNLISRFHRKASAGVNIPRHLHAHQIYR
jgi:hypothetical protein